MQASTLIPVEEYLVSNYDPDREYLDGVLVERNVGEYDHARLQLLLGVFLAAREKQWGLRTGVEQRMQIRADRFRVPDLCLLRRLNPIHQVLTDPPFVCIEILSPADSLESLQERIDDYLGFGVPYVWVVSPRSRRGWIYTAEAIREAKDGMLRAANPDIEVPLAELFDKD